MRIRGSVNSSQASSGKESICYTLGRRRGPRGLGRADGWASTSTMSQPAIIMSASPRKALAPISPNALRYRSLHATIKFLRQRLGKYQSEITSLKARNAELEAELAKHNVETNAELDIPEEDGQTVPCGKLRRLWVMPRRDALVGRRPGGRKPKSGRQMLEDAATVIINSAIVKSNPTAEQLGLGPCLLSSGTRGRGSRPQHFFTARVREDGSEVKFAAMSYHVTWIVYNECLPPAVSGIGFSHRCHESHCVQPSHGVWEDLPTNKGRDICRGGVGVAVCVHDPCCVCAS